MRKLILAATEKELEGCRNHFEKEGNNSLLSFQTIGVGAISAAFYTQQYIAQYRPDIVILVGIAGSFDKEITLGSTFLVRSEIQVTLGVEENGSWQDVFDLGFAPRNESPYQNARLVNPFLDKFDDFDLPIVDSISVDEITTSQDRIRQYEIKYRPILESMEGAAFHFVCLKIGVPFLQLRNVSNYVGERDKSKWNFAQAFAHLNENLVKIIQQLG